MPSIGINAGLTLAKKALGVRLDPYLSYNFLVEIEGIIAGGFMEVSGLSIQTTLTEDKKFGGENDRTYKFVTGTKYTDITLKRGLTDLDLLWSWYDDVIKGKIKRQNGSIYLLDHSGLPAMRWDFIEAYPIKWDGPVFNASGNMVATETLVLTHNGLTKPKESQAFSAIRGIASATGLL
ncbi:MAG: phage tail protein [Firmicutes bacterium]|nr:phage tail protein [Bacillota bacterium]